MKQKGIKRKKNRSLIAMRDVVKTSIAIKRERAETPKSGEFKVLKAINEAIIARSEGWASNFED